MKYVLISILVVSLVSCGINRQSSGMTEPETIKPNNVMHLIQTIPLPNVEGRIDHLSVDIKNQRLFVAALENNTVEIIDLSTGKVVHSISGLSEPQGIIYVPEFKKIFVANGGDGSLDVFDSNTYALLDRLDLSNDADNIRYDVNSKLVYVGHGNGGLSLIDPTNDKILNNIKLDGHPESFQLESSDSRIFINVPDTGQIAVVDSQKQQVVATWQMKAAKANYPMALDEKQHRLFIGFRFPAKLEVFDSVTGNLITSVESVGDADDIFYNAAHKMVFVIGGDGFVNIYSQQDSNHYLLISQVPTSPGARTGLWVPELGRLYVAIPHRGTQKAEIRVYELQL